MWLVCLTLLWAHCRHAERGLSLPWLHAQEGVGGLGPRQSHLPSVSLHSCGLLVFSPRSCLGDAGKLACVGRSPSLWGRGRGDKGGKRAGEQGRVNLEGGRGGG